MCDQIYDMAVRRRADCQASYFEKSEKSAIEQNLSNNNEPQREAACRKGEISVDAKEMERTDFPMLVTSCSRNRFQNST